MFGAVYKLYAMAEEMATKPAGIPEGQDASYLHAVFEVELEADAMKAATPTTVPAVIGFKNRKQRVYESAGVVNVLIIRYGEGCAATTVAYHTEDGTAKKHYDYEPQSGSVTFLRGQMHMKVQILIIDNDEAESNKHFFVRLTECPRGPDDEEDVTVHRSKSRLRVVIVDDDSALAGMMGSCSLLAERLFCCGRQRRRRQRYWGFVLLDAKIGRALTEGTIKLLSCSWLLDERPRVLARRQNLPDDAFLSPEEALSAFRHGQVYVLSYGWLTAEHPDPDGLSLGRVISFLGSGARVPINGWGLFCE